MTELVVYTKPGCVQCNATYRALDKKGIEYSSIDVSVAPEDLEKIRALGYMQAPVVAKYLDGEVVDHWSGFRPDKIDELVAA